MSFTFKFYGDSKISKVWGVGKQLTQEQINNYTIYNYNPTWDIDTYLLPKFNNNLECGNIPTSIGNAEYWSIYRLNQESNFLEYLNKFDISQNTLFDFGALNDNIYAYYIFVNTDTQITNPIVTEFVKSSYYGWFIVDLENNRSYHLDVNFSGADRNHVEDFTEHNLNLKTNTYTRGGNHYLEGEIKAILSNENLKEDIVNTNDLLIEFRNFIRNDKPKLLKSRRNNKYLVLAKNYKEVLLSPDLSENIYLTSFEFKEVGDI